MTWAATGIDTPCQAAPRMRPAQRLTPQEQDQVPRLHRLRESYPHIVIGMFSDRGPWQACIPEGNGETVVTRYLLADLLDRLAVLLGDSQAGQ